MAFYKKIGKRRDASNILSEKEYKCASLLAITNEALKENDKKLLKELVEEINGHLRDLRTIQDDDKNATKCSQLTKRFEECLIKITNNNFDILVTINRQYIEIQHLVNVSIRDNDTKELRRLAERMEGNIAVIKEIPEVKSALQTERDEDRFLEALRKYEDLLKKVAIHIQAQRFTIGHPMPSWDAKQDDLLSGRDNVAAKSAKIPLNEVEDKLKIMRQKRLVRRSAFLDQQKKLDEEQRSREPSPSKPTNSGKTFGNLNQISESSDQEESLLKQSPYKAGMSQAKEPEFEIVKSLRNSFRKSGQADTRQLETTKKLDEQSSFEKSPILSKNSTHFGKSGAITTKSFAERQIENAKNQMQKSSSAKSPPATPTQIRKIFNSFNSCVSGVNRNKSLEDLPGEFKSPFEQELKSFRLKSVGNLSQSESIATEQKLNGTTIMKGAEIKKEPPPIVLPRRNKTVPEQTVKNGTRNGDKKNVPSTINNVNDIEQTESIVRVLPQNTPPITTTDLTIAIKRDSSTVEVPMERRSFSTFRSSTDSLKEISSVANPLYDVVNTSTFRPPDGISPQVDNRTGIRTYLEDVSKELIALQRPIAKLERVIDKFKGLKRDQDYVWLDKLLSKYYVRVDEVVVRNSLDELRKNVLLDRLRSASKNLESRTCRNEVILNDIIDELITDIARKHGIL